MNESGKLILEVDKISQQSDKEFFTTMKKLFEYKRYDDIIKSIELYFMYNRESLAKIFYWKGWALYHKGKKNEAFEEFKRYLRSLSQSITSIVPLLKDFDGGMTNNNKDKEEFAFSLLTDEDYREKLLFDVNLFFLLVSALQTPDNRKNFLTLFSQNFSHILLILQDQRYLMLKKRLCAAFNLQEPVKQFFLEFKPDPKYILDKNVLKTICQGSLSDFYMNFKLNFIKIIYDISVDRYDAIIQDIQIASQLEFPSDIALSTVILEFILPAAHLLNKPNAIETFLPYMKKMHLCVIEIYDWLPIWYQNNCSKLIEKYINCLNVLTVLDGNDSDNNSDDTEQECESSNFNSLIHLISHLAAYIEKNQIECMDFLLKTINDVNKNFFADFSNTNKLFPFDQHILIAAIEINENPGLVQCLCSKFRELPMKNSNKPILISLYRDIEGKIALHYAVNNNQLETTQILLNADITGDYSSVVNCQDHEGNTPLHIACDKKNYAMIFLLLTDPAASFFNRNNKGETSLSLLLAHGANLAIKDHTGKNLMEYLQAANVNIDPTIRQTITEACNAREQGKSQPQVAYKHNIATPPRKKRKVGNKKLEVEVYASALNTSHTVMFPAANNSSSSSWPNIAIPTTTTNTTTPISPTSTAMTSTTIMVSTENAMQLEPENRNDTYQKGFN